MVKMEMMLKEKIRFFLMHSIFSFSLFIVSLYLVFYIWYPSDLTFATGVLPIYGILLFVDFILGPALTLIIYKKDKIKMYIDITIIVILQVSAFLYGLYTLEQGRPAWLVFVIDDIEIVSKSDIKKSEDLGNENFKIGFFEKPIWVAAEYSSNLKIAQQQKEDEMFKGISLAQRPETFVLIDKKKQAIIKKLKPLNELENFNSAIQIVNIVNKYGAVKGWLPVKASNLDMVALFDKNGKPLKIVNLRPWK